MYLLLQCIRRYEIETMNPVNIALDLITVPDNCVNIRIHKVRI